MESTQEQIARNRDSWNAIARHRPSKPAEFFQNGGSTLDDFEPGLLPRIAGSRMLHLACANGNDSLSWATLGAEVVGVDISEEAVRVAAKVAAETGLSASFEAADIYQLPDGLAGFDIVYSSWGVICWLPDLDRWAEIVLARLRPGGTFLLCEHHPLWEVLAVRDGGVRVTFDYFGRDLPNHAANDDAKRPVGATAETPFTTFVWPVSDVLMSLQRAGMVLDEFFEAAEPDMYGGLNDGADRLPALYVIKGHRR